MKLTAGTDAASYRLIAAADAIEAAGDRLLPTRTARAVEKLARGVRSALIASEEGLALRLLDDLDSLLEGAEDPQVVEVLKRRADAVRGPIRFAVSRS